MINHLHFESKISGWRRALVVAWALAPLSVACGSQDPESADDTGSINLALTAPMDALCVEEHVKNVVTGREVVVARELVPGTTQVIDLPSVPAGDVELTAFVTDGFADGACTGNRTYEAEAQRLKLPPGRTANATQRFQARAGLVIDGDFETDIYEAACGEADAVNVALGADASLSDAGWGGGAVKADLTDGLAAYTDTWAHGLAATGGPSGWAGQSCGWRQWTLDLGSVQSGIDRQLIFHHGDYHIPATYVLEYSLDGSSWVAIDDTSSVRNDLRTDIDTWGAVPTEHLFDPISARFLRYRFNNCEMMFPTSDSHGWGYEWMAFSCAVE